MLTFNFHPPLASFPLALFFTVFLLELIDARWKLKLDRFIAALLVFALLCLGLTFLTGYPAAESASRSFVVPPGEVNKHHLIAKLLLFTAIPCVVLRCLLCVATRLRRVFWVCYWGCLLGSIGLVLRVGYLGGELVFRHGAGVLIEVPGGGGN